MYTLSSLRFSALLGVLALTFGLTESPAQSDMNGSPVVTSAESGTPEYDRRIGSYRMHPEEMQLLGNTLGIGMYSAVPEPGDPILWYEHSSHNAYVVTGGSLTVYFDDADRLPYELP